MAVPMFPVNSSHLDQVGWQDGNLYITFKNGKKYKYLDVPEMCFYEMRASNSIGRYFGTDIKNNFIAEEL